MYKPIFNITNSLLNTIAEMEILHTKITNAHILPEREIEMHYRATVEATYNSTSIEGNPLTLKQVDAVLQGHKITRREYHEIEVKNYKRALDHIEKRIMEKTPILKSDILMLHKYAMRNLLPDEKIGALRRGDIYIVDQDERVKYTGPEAETVQDKLNDLIKWLKTEAPSIHPSIAAAILHFQLVTIHPFSDGNGRTARLAVMMYLGIREYDFRSSIVLDSYYAYDKSEYYDALHKCQGEIYSDDVDISSWIMYFTDGFLSSAKVLWAEVNILTTLTAPMAEMQKMSRAETEMLSYARNFGSISLADAESILPDISRRTLQRKLKQLTDNGILRIVGAGKNTKYIWRE
jgi:Fic family protein